METKVKNKGFIASLIALLYFWAMLALLLCTVFLAEGTKSKGILATVGWGIICLFGTFG